MATGRRIYEGWCGGATTIVLKTSMLLGGGTLSTNSVLPPTSVQGLGELLRSRGLLSLVFSVLLLVFFSPPLVCASYASGMVL